MKRLKNLILKHKKLLLGFGVIVVIVLIWRFTHPSKPAVQYQTAQASKGTLIMAVSASGLVSSGNSVDISTQTSGVVDNVYVKNGDEVSQGDKLADITLDASSQQKQAAGWASYLSAKNTLESDQADLNTLQNTEFTANQKFINDAVARGLETNDPTYIAEDAAWKAAEANYINQQDVITQAQAAVNSAWLSYQQISPVITAPTSGTITNLNLTPGLTISQSSSSSTSSSTSQSLGTITLYQGQLQAVVDVAEIDAPHIKPGQKATLTLDAFPGETFTGHVAAIDTNGTVSSGVTTYPTTITLDTTNSQIYPNMAVSANIITKVDNDVITVPSEAVQSLNGQSFVRVLQNGQAQQLRVETGDANDTDTVIISGLNDGNTVIIGTRSTLPGSTGSTSPFSGNRGFGGGGGVIFRAGRGG